ncbi:NADP-dependent oxidoreductase domain-containing protein, partial [Cyathus striatus]
LPAIVYGAGTFSNQYNSDNILASDLPARTVRLALRYGICAFDTSAYYGPSETVLGEALCAVNDEFPRSSYYLMTKCGRYGVSTFDYDPVAIRNSVIRSLKRLKTGYLDVVYLHDVEFGDEGIVRGEGDQKILNAFAELQKLKDEGLIRHIGITGYPLPTLLRLALLILHTPPCKPVDILLSYSHLTLQNSTFLQFVSHFYKRAKVGQLLSASPFSMGLLTPTPPPWHPAPQKLLKASSQIGKLWPPGVPNLALSYSIRHTGIDHDNIPLVTGFSTPSEVHECIKVWREVQEAVDEENRKAAEQAAEGIFRQAGYLDWSWPSPSS